MSVLAESTALARLRARPTCAEPTGFVLLTAAILGLYVILRAPVLDPPNYFDPWIYTALFKNYGYLHSAFGWTYYPSRLPWLIPGMIAHSLFGPITAFFVLHGVFMVAAGLFLFLLLRRFFGTAPAFVGYALMLLSPLFYDSYSNDYPDGALITFLFGAFYFALPAAQGGRRRLRLGLAGFFMAAAVGTNLSSGVILACALALYVAVNTPRPDSLRRVATDAACAAVGALVLLVICGSVSKHYGGAFLFFMPQWHAIKGINSTDYKAPGYGWLTAQTQLIVPLFAAASVLALVSPRAIVRDWRRDIASRLVVGSVAFAVLLYAVIAAWEFAFSGALFETPYYFSLFDLATALCLGSASYLLIRPSRPKPQTFVITCLVAIAAALPMLLVYRWHNVPTARAAGWPVAGMVAGSLLLLAATRNVIRGTAAALVVAACLCAVSFSANYAAAAGGLTLYVFDSSKSVYGYRRDTLLTALQLMAFMRENHLQTSVPAAFWYNPRSAPELNGIQSTYLWGDSWIGLDMPKMTPDVYARLNRMKPPYVVLLCLERGCAGASSALEGAGYPLRPAAEKRLGSGTVHIWVHAYRLPRFRLSAKPRVPGDLAGVAELSKPMQGRPVRAWRFVKLPAGWSGTSSDAVSNSRGGVFSTSNTPWSYELMSPKLTLQPGSYRVELSGDVRTGGIDLGILDSPAGKWIAQALYSSEQKGYASKVMATRFTLTKSTEIQVVLSNWVPKTQSSQWLLRALHLVRITS